MPRKAPPHDSLPAFKVRNLPHTPSTPRVQSSSCSHVQLLPGSVSATLGSVFSHPPDDKHGSPPQASSQNVASLASAKVSSYFTLGINSHALSNPSTSSLTLGRSLSVPRAVASLPSNSSPPSSRQRSLLGMIGTDLQPSRSQYSQVIPSSIAPCTVATLFDQKHVSPSQAPRTPRACGSVVSDASAKVDHFLASAIRARACTHLSTPRSLPQRSSYCTRESASSVRSPRDLSVSSVSCVVPAAAEAQSAVEICKVGHVDNATTSATNASPAAVSPLRARIDTRSRQNVVYSTYGMNAEKTNKSKEIETPQGRAKMEMLQTEAAVLREHLGGLRCLVSEAVQHRASHVASELAHLRSSREQQPADLSQAESSFQETTIKIFDLLDEAVLAAKGKLSMTKDYLERLRSEMSCELKQRERQAESSSREKISRLQESMDEQVTAAIGGLLRTRAELERLQTEMSHEIKQKTREVEQLQCFMSTMTQMCASHVESADKIATQCQAGSSFQEKNNNAQDLMDENLQFEVGVYQIVSPVLVKESFKTDSLEITELAPHEFVRIVEVKVFEDRVRARIEKPPGWISIINKTAGMQYAVRVEKIVRVPVNLLERTIEVPPVDYPEKTLRKVTSTVKHVDVSVSPVPILSAIPELDGSSQPRSPIPGGELLHVDPANQLVVNAGMQLSTEEVDAAYDAEERFREREPEVPKVDCRGGTQQDVVPIVTYVEEQVSAIPGPAVSTIRNFDASASRKYMQSSQPRAIVSERREAFTDGYTVMGACEQADIDEKIVPRSVYQEAEQCKESADELNRESVTEMPERQVVDLLEEAALPHFGEESFRESELGALLRRTNDWSSGNIYEEATSKGPDVLSVERVTEETLSQRITRLTDDFMQKSKDDYVQKAKEAEQNYTVANADLQCLSEENAQHWSDIRATQEKMWATLRKLKQAEQEDVRVHSTIAEQC